MGRIVLALSIALLGGMVYYALSQSPISQKLPLPSLPLSAIAEVPRNDQPMENLTALYEKRQVTLSGPDQRNHELTYWWREPSRLAKPDEYFPLVVVLHGSPGKAYAAKYLATEPVRTQHPAFVLVPVIPQDALWSFPEKLPPEFMSTLGGSLSLRHMLPYIAEIVQGMKTQYPIDPRRIYVIGCSQGGWGAFGAARDYPDIFAAAVSISGGWTPEDSPKLIRIPILAIHGRQDENVPAAFSRDVVSLIKQYGGPALYAEFPEMNHQCPASELYSEALWNWLFKQYKK